MSPAPENIIARDFHADAPNEKWLADILAFPIAAGKVYLSPVIDCFDGKVINWSIGRSPDAELFNTMLDAVIEAAEGSTATTIVHSIAAATTVGRVGYSGLQMHVCLDQRPGKRALPPTPTVKDFSEG